MPLQLHNLVTRDLVSNKCRANLILSSHTIRIIEVDVTRDVSHNTNYMISLIDRACLAIRPAQYVNCAAANSGADAGMYDASSEQYKLSTETPPHKNSAFTEPLFLLFLMFGVISANQVF